MALTEEDFSRLYEKYKNTVFSVIYNYVKNVDDALELQQEVFIKFLRQNKDFETDEHIKAWLIRVSINQSINFIRDNKKHIHENLKENEDSILDTESFSVMPYILELPEKYRIPIHLFYYEEYSVKEIASVLKMPLSTVKIRLKRGRELLKKRMGEDNINGY